MSVSLPPPSHLWQLSSRYVYDLVNTHASLYIAQLCIVLLEHHPDEKRHSQGSSKVGTVCTCTPDVVATNHYGLVSNKHDRDS